MQNLFAVVGRKKKGKFQIVQKVYKILILILVLIQMFKILKLKIVQLV